MPKAKRNKQISLTRTKKKNFDLKKQLIEEIHSCLDRYTNLFLFTVNDMRNNKLKEVREKWKTSRFLFGKNKIMVLALGKTAEDEHRQNLSKMSKRLRGQCGLLFSNQSKDEVTQWFEDYSESTFARSGCKAAYDVLLKEGAVSQLHFSLEPYLRTKLGMPTALQKGIVHVVKDFQVCKEGDVLTPEKAKILELLGHQMAEFHISIDSHWSSDGSFSTIALSAPNDDVEMESDEGDDHEEKSDDDEEEELEGSPEEKLVDEQEKLADGEEEELDGDQKEKSAKKKGNTDSSKALPEKDKEINIITLEDSNSGDKDSDIQEIVADDDDIMEIPISSEPEVSEQKKEEPVVSVQKEDEPIISVEKEEEPVVSIQEEEEEPVVSIQEEEEEPVVSVQKEEEPAVTKATPVADNASKKDSEDAQEFATPQPRVRGRRKVAMTEPKPKIERNQGTSKRKLEGKSNPTTKRLSLNTSSSDEKSPIFRSLRNRTVKIKRKK